MDFSFDVYWHSRISDPRCQAVVEVILVERMNDGVVRGRYSLGWATLPLFKVRSGLMCQDPAGFIVVVIVAYFEKTHYQTLLMTANHEDERKTKRTLLQADLLCLHTGV